MCEYSQSLDRSVRYRKDTGIRSSEVKIEPMAIVARRTTFSPADRRTTIIWIADIDHRPAADK